MYILVYEDSSTESTCKLPTEVEFRKKSNVLILEVGIMPVRHKTCFNTCKFK